MYQLWWLPNKPSVHACEIAVFACQSCQVLFPCLTFCSRLCWQQGSGKAEGPAEGPPRGQSCLAQDYTEVQAGSPRPSAHLVPPPHPALRPASKQARHRNFKKGNATCCECQQFLCSRNKTCSPDSKHINPTGVSMLNFGAGGTTQQRGHVVKVTKVHLSGVERGVLRLKNVQAILLARQAGKADQTDAVGSFGSHPTSNPIIIGVENECLRAEAGGQHSRQVSSLNPHLPVGSPGGNKAVPCTLPVGSTHGDSALVLDTLALTEGGQWVSLPSCV
jgi:hypothetical protein